MDPEIKKILGGNDYFMVPYDNVYAYLPEIIGNIHYGYIVCSAIPDVEIVREIANLPGKMAADDKASAEKLVGVNDSSDDTAVKVGAELWMDHGGRLIQQHLKDAIIDNRQKWNRFQIDFMRWAKSRFSGTEFEEFVKDL